MKYHLSIIMALFISFWVIMLPDSHILAETANESDINLDLSPERTLFDIENMKPGDWAPRTVTVGNTGKGSFDYTIKLKEKNTDQLFNELQFEVTKENKVLYDGKLADFKNVQSSLASEKEEDLQMTIRFPKHLGNEFQGKTTAFAFIFTAEGQNNEEDTAGIDGMVDSGDGGNGVISQLPQTATAIFNYLLIGILILGSGILLAVYQRKKRLIGFDKTS